MATMWIAVKNRKLVTDHYDSVLWFSSIDDAKMFGTPRILERYRRPRRRNGLEVMQGGLTTESTESGDVG